MALNGLMEIITFGAKNNLDLGYRWIKQQICRACPETGFSSRINGQDKLSAYWLEVPGPAEVANCAYK